MKRLLAVRERLTPPMPWRWHAAAAAGLLSGLVWSLIALLIGSQSVRAALAGLATPRLWLTALFLGLAVLALSLLSHSLFAGNLIIGAAATVLSFASYFKQLITTVPLTVGDFTLIGQAGNIAGLNSGALTLSRNSVLAILAAVLWLLLALFFSEPLRIEWRRSALGGGAAALAFVLIFWFGSNTLVFAPLGAGTDRHIPQRTSNESCGVILGLWRSVYQLVTRDMGADYSQAHMESVTAQAQALTAGQDDGQAGGEQGEEKKVRPNVILILSESFFDVTGLENVTFEQDPAAEFRALKEEGVSGPFFTRSLGYGTCNIELEVLTGMNTGLLSGEDLYSWSPDVFTRLPSVPSILQSEGYYTAMLHMFDDSIYHRTGIFSQLGFDDLYFSPDFAGFHEPAAQAADYWAYMNDRIAGSFYSDDLMTDLLISLYEKHDADGPVFLYGISMENHSTYVDKYGWEELTVSPESPLTGEAANDLLNLSQGVRNASAALGRLADYFRLVDEPTVIVFFGDHRPGLGLSDGGTVYSELGMVPADTGVWTADDYARLYSTDYLIWSNDPSYLPARPGSEAETSCNYLGAAILEIAGADRPLYWKLISQLAKDRVADTVYYHRGADGITSFEAPTDGLGARGLALLTELLNDAVYGRRYVTDDIG